MTLSKFPYVRSSSVCTSSKINKRARTSIVSGDFFAGLVIPYLRSYTITASNETSDALVSFDEYRQSSKELRTWDPDLGISGRSVSSPLINPVEDNGVYGCMLDCVLCTVHKMTLGI
jgi:hypothetical protein